MPRRLLTSLVLLVAGCSAAPERAAAPPTVVVSVLPQAWFVEHLAGDACRIEVMIPPGANPTTYEPSLKQMEAAARADLYVRVGDPHFAFERAWFDDIAADADAPVVDFATGDDSGGDPHVWTSPRDMAAAARRVADALKTVRGLDPDAVDGRLLTLLAEIDSLDAETGRALAPYRGKRFFVFHAAWGYFARDYELEQVAIEHGHMEPSAGNLESVIADARRSGARSILVQPQFSRQSAELVAGSIGAALVTVDPLDRDWPRSIRDMTSALLREFEK